MNSMAIKMVSEMAKGKIDATIQENTGWFSLDVVKCYFDVTNEYVLNKPRIILFPFSLKEEGWKRQSTGFEDEEQPTPRNDLQAPDLYIPLMAFVTYILLVGCFKGFVKQNFNVEDLLVIQSWGIFLWVFESLLQKGFLYFFNIANPPFCELLAYTGYKYVIMCVLVLGNLGLGTYGFYALLVLFGGLFMLFFYRN